MGTVAEAEEATRRSSALQWTGYLTGACAAPAAELAIDPTCLTVAGDSADGTLAAVVCQTAKGSRFKIALQVLLCPVTDIAADKQSREFAEGYFLEGR
jgi:acetyl esterase/lipase